MLSFLAGLFKRQEEIYSGVVERMGVVQESSGDAGRTRYALLLVGESQPRVLSTEPGTCLGLSQGESEAHEALRVRVALTQPGDRIFVRNRGAYVVSYDNETLAMRLLRRTA